MEAADRTARNADELDRRLGSIRHEPGGTSETRHARLEAVAQLNAYVALLRRAAPATPGSDGASSVPAHRRRRMLKLEFGDGRWDVTEAELELTPAVGEHLRLADGRMSRVTEIQMVASGRTRKPPREIVVCQLCA